LPNQQNQGKLHGCGEMKGNMMKQGSLFKALTGAVVISALIAPATLGLAAEEKSEAKTETIKGEVVDLMCYLDHGAKGEKHKSCAEKCIKSGGPVGILSGDKLYLVVGDHKPINSELAAKAAETVSIKGKVVERDGMRMIENAELE
jgi:hypothetical protein